jgi:hypothetical protein
MDMIKELKRVRETIKKGDRAYDITNELISKILFKKEQAKMAWIKTYTGLRFHAFNPKPDQISLVDIAHSLSKKGRFSDHCPVDYTVGEHSLHCYALLKLLGCDEQTQLIGLLHDASEAYLQDIPKPFKHFIDGYSESEDIVQNAVYMKYLGFVPTEEQYKIVKMVDEIMLINEVEQLMPPDNDWFLPQVDKMIHVDLKNTMNWEDTKVDFLITALELGAKD